MQNKKSIILIIILLLAISCGVPSIYDSIFTIILVLYLCFFSIKSDYSTIKFIAIVMSIQNIFLLVCSSILNEKGTDLITYYKFFIIIFTCTVSIILKGNIRVLIKHKEIIVFLAILAFSFITSDIDTTLKIANAMQLFSTMIMFMLGYSIKKDKFKYEDLLLTIVIIALIISIFGLVERMFFTEEFWRKIGYTTYRLNIGKSAIGFYTSYDFINILGIPIRRMISVFIDPLATAHFIALGLLILKFNGNIIKNKGFRILIKIIYLISIILTLSKGAVLVVLIGYLIYYKKVYKKRSYLIIITTILSLLAIYSIGVYISNPTSKTSINNHINGFLHNFSNISFLGNGLGSVGNRAIANEVGSGVSGESFIGTLMGQIGIIGLSVYMCFYFKIILRIKRFIKVQEDTSLVFSYALLCALLFESLLAETAISYLGTGMYFILIGINTNEL